jgi:putative Holliday junction resolvase
MIITTLQEFYTFFKLGKPLLSIDYGNKKIGIAISSPDHFIAMPHSIIIATKEPEKLDKIAKIAQANNICALVIGLPIYMDGTHSEHTKTVTNFAEKLVNKTNLPIYLQDERLTTRAADSLLKMMGLNRKQRNERDDMSSASLILETVLESVRKL